MVRESDTPLRRLKCNDWLQCNLELQCNHRAQKRRFFEDLPPGAWHRPCKRLAGMTTFERSLGLTFLFGQVVLATARAQTDYLPVGPCMLDSSKKSLTEDKREGGYRLVLQSDGNLVLYLHPWGPVWESSTSGDNKACLTPDGVLEIRDIETGRCVWSTPPGFSATKSGVFMKIQDDGKLVIYEGRHRNARPVSESCGFRGKFADGNERCKHVATNWCSVGPPRRVR